ncbi:MAG: glycosyltransferase [Acidobacteria bacterium]|nr:glycosyltransferase [Acidobacteriota bacterium]MCL5287666.1 glycosyltransferase [Acidobacteriota bacterium]
MPSESKISAIVPARNEEANIARAVESLAAQPEIAEIIVVNDQSTDRTAAILNELAAKISQLRVVQGSALPAGWTGKNFALTQGVAQTGGEWLLFTDADVEHLPGSAARALADAETSGAALVSYSPEQETRAWWEKAVIPFIFCRLAAQFSYARVSNPARTDAAANGQYLLIRRDAYNFIGGHAAVRGEVVEDVALAKRAKQAKYRILFTSGAGIARTRMYRSHSEMWQGWTKNLYPLMGGQSGAVALELLTSFPWPLLLTLALIGFVPAAKWLALIFALGEHSRYARALRWNRYPVSRIIYYLPAAFWYAAALVTSARRYAHSSVTWKGREVPVKGR